MESAKKIVKKKATTKKRVVKKGPEMISYSIKMVIPTGQYANIQPEIIVKGGTLEEAHAYVAPHMNKLWKEYFMVSERRPEPKAQPTPSQTVNTEPTPTPKETVATPPISSVAYQKATQAIESCLSMDALNLIIEQIRVSVKLTQNDKDNLAGLIMFKEEELKDKENAKTGK